MSRNQNEDFAMMKLLPLLAVYSCLSFVSMETVADANESCGYDWSCWNMYELDEVPVWTNDDPSSPGYYDPEVPSPVLIYLHSNGPYGPLGPRENGGVQEEEYWLRLWCQSDDGYEDYRGLKNWTVDYQPSSGGETKETGWIYVLPDGAADKPENQTCSDEGSWAGWRYWNATPNCCAYNWYVEDSYTEVGSGAPNHLVYINELITYLKENYNVDRDRIYIYGYSNGGYMAHALACHNGDYAYYGATPEAIAAIGTYAGVTYMNPTNCYGLWPTNVLHTHDIADTECLYDGGLDQAFAGACYEGYPRPYPGAIATVSSWIFLNQTVGTGEILEPVQPFDLNVPYSTAQVIDWPDGRNGSRVQHWRGIFGSHFASFSSNYRNRLVEWFLENPRPDYDLYEPCLGDYDDDGTVDANDILIILDSWNKPYGVNDILVVIESWGGCGE